MTISPEVRAVLDGADAVFAEVDSMMLVSDAIDSIDATTVATGATFQDVMVAMSEVVAAPHQEDHTMLKIVCFEQVQKGATFSCNGNDYEKRSSRTGKGISGIVSGMTFYFGKSDRCYVCTLSPAK